MSFSEEEHSSESENLSLHSEESSSDQDMSDIDFEFQELHQSEQLEPDLPSDFEDFVEKCPIEDEPDLPSDFEDFVEKCLIEDQRLLKSGEYRYKMTIATTPKLNEIDKPTIRQKKKSRDRIRLEKTKKMTQAPDLKLKKIRINRITKKNEKSLSGRLSSMPSALAAKMDEEDAKNRHLQLELMKARVKGNENSEDLSMPIELLGLDEPFSNQQNDNESTGVIESKTRKFRGKKRSSVGDLTEMKRYKCKLCVNVYSDKNDWKRHLETHKVLRKTRFECDECDFVANQEHKLRAHKLRHLTPRPKVKYTCQYCPYAVYKSSLMDRHEKEHKGTPFFPCDESDCDFKAKTIISLKNHKQLHAEEKVFKCAECPYSFYRKNSLVEHMRKHEGFAKFQCDLCPSTFSRNSNMLAHKRKFH